MGNNQCVLRILCGVALMSIIAGCGGPSYKQPVADNCAVIRVDSDMAYISQVDGTSTTDAANRTARSIGLLIGSDFPIGKLQVSVTPGKHTIQVQTLTSVAELWLVAEPKVKYVVKFKGTKQGQFIWIEDELSAQSVGGIKGSADEPPDIPPSPPDTQAGEPNDSI